MVIQIPLPDNIYTNNGTCVMDKILMREDRKKNVKIENLDSGNFLTLQVAYFAFKKIVYHS